MESLTRKWWRLIAVTIIVLVAGPEIFLYAEGMVMLEVVGAATFVFMYVVGAKLYLRNLWDWVFNFENRYDIFLPSLSILRARPALLYYVIPKRTMYYVSLLFLVLLFSFKII